MNRKLRRAVPILATALALGGCSALGGGDAASLVALAKNVWNGNSGSVTLEQAAAVPYASLGIRVGDGPEGMLILAGDTDGQLLWTSGAGAAISTRNGRIVRTAGFAQNLGGYESRGDTPGTDGMQTVRWQADFPDLNLYSVSITCQDRPAGNETIIILGKDIHTKRMDETCASDESRLGWAFDNTYWLDPSSGVVWRSIQHIHPGFNTIETEILRPPA
ncbi:MAG: YjbF family lipoprotein [Alphaproteobacteria bacterium]|nr:YjbF family lipoprotein [Alphaproteobacteria bacterium]MDE2495645.1 YjbF family lipoprotein [Alphaproteobacteria bacterium]